MHIRIIAIGTKMPAWVTEGFQEYAKRFATPYSLQLIEIPAERRTQPLNVAPLIKKEGEKILSFIKSTHLSIALDVQGQSWDTLQLSKQLEKWQHEGRNIDFIIGGPDGLSSETLQKIHLTWSLSPLTFPHPLVRILLVEQLYRAITILQHHPYHR